MVNWIWHLYTDENLRCFASLIKIFVKILFEALITYYWFKKNWKKIVHLCTNKGQLLGLTQFLKSILLNAFTDTVIIMCFTFVEIYSNCFIYIDQTNRSFEVTFLFMLSEKTISEHFMKKLVNLFTPFLNIQSKNK